MQAGPSPAREARLGHRHGVRTLTYVILDQGNGGILLNLTHSGVAVQSVAAVHMGQQVQVRFELFAPRLRVNARGEVVWATSSGRCGIRFLDLSTQVARKLDEWIFAKLLEGTSPLSPSTESVLAAPAPLTTEAQNRAAQQRTGAPKSLPGNDEEVDELSDGDEAAEELDALDDNLIISPGPVKVIDLPRPNLPPPSEPLRMPVPIEIHDRISQPASQLDWLSRPLSGRGLAWTVNALMVLAGWLLFVLVFLAVLGEAPRWPGVMIPGAAVVVAGLYWGFFKILAGASLGVKLARLAGSEQNEDGVGENRFR